MLTRLNATLARLAMFAAVAGLWTIVGLVSWQVFGRYVLNDTPTWAESLTLVVILYVALIGAAVGVRDAGHIGMESLLVLVADETRRRIEIVIFVFVGMFGAMMLYYGWGLTSGVIPLQDPDARHLRGLALRAAARVRAADHAVLDRAHDRADPAPTRSFRHGTDDPRALVPVPAADRRAGRVRDRPVRRRDDPLRRAAGPGHLPADDVRDERVQLPRDPVLHLRRRADAARRHRRQDRRLREDAGRPRPRRARHVERHRLHAVRRHLGLAGRRRLGDGLGDDPDDEEGRLRRRLRGERHHARVARRCADADVAQHDHLLARGGRARVDRRTDPRRRRADDRARRLHAGRRLLGRRAPQLPARHLARLGCGRRARAFARCPGLFVAVIIIVGHPLRRVHGDGIGGHRGALRDPHHVRRLPHDDAGRTS